ncbi:MAG: 5-carboxymethyl-2-hydroxymuconate Delta-isomerase [Pseudomonadota bacterium]
MPHLTLEYSANLKDASDFGTLCTRLAHCLAAQQDGGAPLFPLGGIRVRAFAADTYCIADGTLAAAFVHANLKIGAGRSETARKQTGDALFAVIKAHFDELYARTGLALSLEINEFSESGSWKHNNLHTQLRALTHNA